MLTDYHVKYFSHELTKRSSAGSMEKLAASLLDAQVDLNPHQVEAALFAFKSPLSKGALLADEVGLGKTIEAGLVISQKWAERKRNILIVTPSNLRPQWSQELVDKFFLNSLILETKSFNEEIKKGNLNPFAQDKIIICSYNFVKSKEAYIKNIDWNLIVIDEAHRLRNVYKPKNKIANAIKNAVANRPLVLLTATPLQNSLLELFGLVSIIDEHIFGDIKSFKSQFAKLSCDDNFDNLKARLAPICKRTLRRQVLEYIRYTNRKAITQEYIPSEDEQSLYDMVSLYLQRDNLYALPPGQRTLMTLILRKLLASSTFAISGTLEALSKKLESVIVENQFKEIDSESILLENYESYTEIRDEWEGKPDENELTASGDTENDEFEVSDNDEKNESEDENYQYTKEDIEFLKTEVIDLKDFAKHAKSIIKNSKGEVLLTALQKGFEAIERLGAEKKAIIFTESRRTQEYLYTILEATAYSGKIVLFNGSNNDLKSNKIFENWLEKNSNTDRITGSNTSDKRAAIVEYFKNEAIIMIATEAAAEGINLQFCSLVVNYDLPWNPQRIEQRIGRCHRYGQKYDVVVVNFLNKKNAADQRVYELLSTKFKLFDGVFGSSDEVLGSIESGVDFEKRIAGIYQTCRTQEEIKTSFDRLQSELEEKITSQIRDTKQQLLENFDEEVHEKLRINLKESTEYIGKYENWLWEITKYFLKDCARFDSDAHSFQLLHNPFSSEPIHPGPYRIGKSVDDSNIYRIGHPLAQRIIESCKNKELAPGRLTFNLKNHEHKISILDELSGKTGYLRAIQITIDAFEIEDHILLYGMTDNGAELSQDQCRRLFSLSASTEIDKMPFITDTVKQYIEDGLVRLESEIIQSNTERNSVFFDSEMDKLDKWADDIKNSMEIQLKELDKNIKADKTEAKKILNLEEKLGMQRNIKEMEKKRNALRQNLFIAQDDIDKKKENLMNEIEGRLRQRIERKELFWIEWSVI